jgi:CheY-like chemotaxis protein
MGYEMVTADDFDQAFQKTPTPRALLVEDDVLIRMDMADTLRANGWEVVEVGTADDAIRVLIRDTDFELLLTDVHMPGTTNGLELARLAKAHPHIKVAVMSGEHLPSASDEKPFDMFLAKPVGDLMKKLSPLLSRPHDGKSSS